MRVLSGIQPTGRFHFGNYFGAIRQYIDLQEGNEAYYFIANLHALTTVRDPKLLRELTFDAALDLLALGLHPERAVLFVQSDVPEVSELSWLLMTGTPMGLLERCHAYKDKLAKGLPADAGLFAYPVLMAADILIYDAEVVPVGADQTQHIEVCRDVAASFNHHFGQTFVLPKAKVVESSAKVPGTDGEKMSKSYNNTLELFEEPKALRKKIMRITTDSRPWNSPKSRKTTTCTSSIRSSPPTPNERKWRPCIAAAVSATGRSRPHWPIWPTGSSPSPASAGRNWRPARSGFMKSWATAPAAREKRRPKYCERPAGVRAQVMRCSNGVRRVRAAG